MLKKLSRQDVFNVVWEHYVVEAQPFSVEVDQKANIPFVAYTNDNGQVSPIGVVMSINKTKRQLNNAEELEKIFNRIKNMFISHVDFDFFDSFEKAHYNAIKHTYSGINFNKTRNFYARRFTREFRKTFRYYLIGIAMKHGLTIPAERAITKHARLVAAKNKK